ncbi:hypothetical protein [Nonomuraea sp. SBT364]|uniref:hypothetical protein n=1 Tax=Nonomuraea sp. SBT364 TaxID=1580530 RepID=UPI00066BAFDB|nr:hypothetical protein [Nonomuraea sp. SBT364]
MDDVEFRAHRGEDEQVGSALGTAVLGTVFFSGLSAGPTAAADTLWIVAAMISLTFLAGFLLPRKAGSVHPARRPPRG